MKTGRTDHTPAPEAPDAEPPTEDGSASPPQAPATLDPEFLAWLEELL